MTASILDDVAGIGPVRKKALYKHFKSFKNIRSATLEQLRECPGITDEVAGELYRVLVRYNTGQDEEKEFV